MCYNIMVVNWINFERIFFGGKIMSVKWEKKEGNDGILTFEVDVDTFEKALDQAFNKVVKDVELPGFRKGRIPRQIFESRFGVESLYQDRSEERRVGKRCRWR